MKSKIAEYQTLHEKAKTCSKEELDMVKKQERIAANFIKSGISFRPSELNRLLATYMTLKDGNLYVPKTIGTGSGPKRYCGILKQENLNREKKKYCLYTKDTIEKNGIITFEFDESYGEFVINLCRRMATYQFLIDKYELKDMYNPDDYEENMISETNFEEHEDIKELIMYLAELQIEKNEHYNYDEMLEILSNYLEQKKPKTRKLV